MGLAKKQKNRPSGQRKKEDEKEEKRKRRGLLCAMHVRKVEIDWARRKEE